MGVRSALHRRSWRQRGFHLSDAEIAEIEGFFETWFPIYNQPDIAPYRSQEALFASFNGLAALAPESIGEREQKAWVSASRAGYCVGLAESELRMRGGPDHNLRQLLKLMEDNDEVTSGGSLETAMRRADRLTEVIGELVIDRPSTGRELQGFHLREAIFVDIKATLFVKLKLTNFPARISGDLGDLLLRWGHVLAVCEEALPAHEPVATVEG